MIIGGGGGDGGGMEVIIFTWLWLSDHDTGLVVVIYWGGDPRGSRVRNWVMMKERQENHPFTKRYG